MLSIEINIYRSSIEEAEKVAKELLPDAQARKVLLLFLLDAIDFAKKMKEWNWNLNLDKNRRFIRFNTGQEYCITIYKKYSLILILKKSLEENQRWIESVAVEFIGHQGKKKFFSKNFRETPDCLVKVPGSVGCCVSHENIVQALPHLKESNRQFIAEAINSTKITPLMKRTHSSGFIDYLSRLFQNNISAHEHSVQTEIKKMTDSELNDKIEDNADCGKPVQVNVNVLRFKRNIYISEFAKRKAKGICCDCNHPAPFISKLTNEPFLETHHIIPLAEGGEDTAENTIALCPNCHRKRHYG